MTHKKNDVDFRTLMRRRCARMVWHLVSNAFYRRNARAQQVDIEYFVSYSVSHLLQPISVYTKLKTEHLEDMYVRLSNEIEKVEELKSKSFMSLAIL